MGQNTAGETGDGATPKVPVRLNTIAYYWGLFSLGIVVASIGPSLPQLATRTGVTIGAIGILLSAFRGGYMTGALVGGSALDRLRGNGLVAVGVAAMAGGLVIVGLLPTIVALSVVFVVIGLAAGVAEVGVNTLLVWVHGKRVGLWMNGLHFAFGVGAMLSPFLIGQALRITGDLNPAFLISACVILPGVVLLLAARSPSAPPSSSATNSRDDVRMVILVAALFLLYLGTESSFGGWIYTWSIEVHELEPARAGALTSLFWAMLTAGRLLAIPVAARFSPRTMLIGTVIGATASLALIASPAGRASVTVVWLAVAGAGLSMAAIVPTIMSFAGRNMRLTGLSTRWFFVGSGAGGMVFPWAIGRLMDGIGPRAVMPAILVVMLLMGGTLVLLLRRVEQS